MWLDVNNCADSQYSIPKGYSDTPWTWTSTLTGRVVFTGGHVHNGGLYDDLANQTTGEHLCKSTAGYGTKAAYQGSIESMSTCVWDRLGAVRSGDVLMMHTVYDSPEARSDVMGIMIAYVYETADLQGGTLAPASVTSPGGGGSGSAPPSGGHQH